MTRTEFIAQWVGATAEARFNAFLAWLGAEISPVNDLVADVQIVRDATANPVTANSPSDFEVDPDIFSETEPATALAVGDAIVQVVYQKAMEESYKRMKEKEAWEKAYRKQREKELDTLLKDAKPKGSKSGYGDYYLYKIMKELEYGSG